MKKMKSEITTGEKKSVAELLEKPAPKDFLLVGIGASAGGIKALKEFFAAMPADSGMAFVVILHLSQTHESSLAEILQRETAMPVEQLTETVKVEPNRVYVIPPGKHLEMIDGIIRLLEPERVKGARVPIDRFFRTLADVYGTRAVCIILSGTGTDGTVGMKYIKGRDGFAIVQDPLDAEFDGMPRSAIETQIADVILPVAEMPEKLLSVRDSTERFRLRNGKDGEVAKEIKNIELLRDVLTLLRVRTGHDFANYKRPTLVRRVARHLQIHETDDLHIYLEILRNKPDEVLSLLKNLLINVTNFFRDKEAFEILERKIIPQLFEGKTSANQVRGWIAGCASGEEAYSTAILLAEYAATLSDPPKIQIFASDVDEDAIAEAREGRFTEAAVSDVAPVRLRQFFNKDEDGSYRIRKVIREMILFAPHNILRDPPFSRLDLVSCRNVLIYLNRETQEKVLQVFHFALRDGGFLFLGSSESAENGAHNFAAIDKKHRIYQRRPVSPNWNAPTALPMAGVWLPQHRQISMETKQNLQSFGELHYRLIEHYAPPSVLVNEEGDILHLSENAGQFLRFVGGEPTANLLKVIDPTLLPDVRAALFAAKQENKTVEAKNIRVKINGDEKIVNIIVRPLQLPEAAALVMFEEIVDSPLMEANVQAIAAGDKAMETVVRRMEDELKRTKDQLRHTIEQYEIGTEELKASNEELQAINEELRSASEELETSKEELQSVNEELVTVNAELKDKVEEISRTNSDLQNLILSTDVATIFLDRKLHLKRYTPTVTEIFNIIPTDLNRPLSHITHRFADDNFAADAAKSLQDLQTFEREVRTTDDRIFVARFAPYRTLEDKIEGVVIAFTDITKREETENLLKEERAYAEAIVATVREPLIVLDKDLRVVSASQSFYESFEVAPFETEGKLIYDLGNCQWNIPALRELLENILPKRSELQDFQVEHVFESIGRRTMRLNAREIRREGEGRRLILLAIADITERKRAEEARRVSEEKYRTLFNSIDEGFCINELLYDDSGKPFDLLVLETNPNFDRLMHVENAVGKRASEIFPNVEESGFEAYASVAKTGESLRFENYLASLDRWFDLYISRVGGADSCRFAIVFSDITERKDAEEALRQSGERFRILSDTAPALIWFDDADGNCLYVNQAYADFYGKPVTGTNWLLMLHPDDVEDYISDFLASQREKRPFHHRVRAQRHDGEWRWIESFAKPLFGTNGEFLGHVGVSPDITATVKAEEAVRQSEARQAYLLKLGDAIRPLREAVDIVETTSQTAMDHFKTDRCFYAEIEGDVGVVRRDAHRADLLSVEKVYSLHEMPLFTSAVETGQPVAVSEVKTSNAMDEPLKQLCLSENIHAYLDVPILKDNRLVGIFCLTQASAREWTNIEIELAKETAERTWAAVERARVEQALKEADRRKDEFLATLAHELRNPLAPIRIGLEVMKRRESQERGTEARQVIERQVTQIIHLVNDLLDISRISQGKIMLQIERVALTDIINMALETNHSSLIDARHEMIVSLPTTPIYVNGDFTRLTQIVLNLLNNAVKYTEPGGTIQLSATIEDYQVIIRVRDTGIGIPAEMLPRIFDAFTQVEHSSKQMQGGLGIGLSLVKTLVEMHGGTIDASSEDVGSEFVVRLPLAESQQPEPSRAPEVESVSAPRQHVLVVDDNEDALQMMNIILTMQGHEVVTAVDGASAIEIARAVRPTVGVLDIGLPDMTGYDVARKIRQHLPNILLIALSGWGREEDRAKSREAGFDFHLVKPVDPEQLQTLFQSNQRM